MTNFREELAWAAGFFDGEGTTSLMRGKYGRMSIHQVEREPLDRFQGALLGIGQVNGPYPNGTHQPIHHWRVNGFAGVQAGLAMLWPFLSEPKRAQARPVLETMNFFPPRWMTDRTFKRERCHRGHDLAIYRSRAGQCRMCMRVTDAKRKGYFSPEWVAKWEAEGGVAYTGW